MTSGRTLQASFAVHPPPHQAKGYADNASVSSFNSLCARRALCPCMSVVRCRSLSVSMSVHQPCNNTTTKVPPPVRPATAPFKGPSLLKGFPTKKPFWKVSQQRNQGRKGGRTTTWHIAMPNPWHCSPLNVLKLRPLALIPPPTPPSPTHTHLPSTVPLQEARRMSLYNRHVHEAAYAHLVHCPSPAQPS